MLSGEIALINNHCYYHYALVLLIQISRLKQVQIMYSADE